MGDELQEKRTEIFEHLFGQSEQPLNSLKNLISCRNRIIGFTGKKLTVYTPFIEKREIDNLEKEIREHRKNNKNNYILAIRADNDLKSDCNEELSLIHISEPTRPY